jgi:hypothetical protein
MGLEQPRDRRTSFSALKDIVNIKTKLTNKNINPDIYVGGEKRLKSGALAPKIAPISNHHPANLIILQILIQTKRNMHLHEMRLVSHLWWAISKVHEAKNILLKTCN